MEMRTIKVSKVVQQSFKCTAKFQSKFWNSTYNSGFVRYDITGSSNVIRYRCDPEKELEEVLQIPAENPQKVEALIETAQHRMSETEVELGVQ